MDKDNNRGMRDWLIFIRIAETRSQTEAARQLNISTAAVSKAINRFEKYLGATLFLRSVHGMFLTEDGQKALKHALEITSAFHLLLEEMRNPNDEIKGVIKLTAPAIVCEFLATEWAYNYTQKNKKVKVIINSRERSDINNVEFDEIILRSGRVENEDLVHRPLSSVKLLLCATKEYLNSNPKILHPLDLEEHMIFSLHHNGLEGPLTLINDGESITINTEHDSGITSDNTLGMLNLVLKGYGICVATPKWLAQNYNDELEVILPNWIIPELPVWLIWRQRTHRTRLFLDFRNYVERCWNERYKKQ